ncbi:hypothetical protein KY289_010686 [Solanum tuberosum]|nr:hypothetical protein KY289_010686 [Solanum tuberosum]
MAKREDRTSELPVHIIHHILCRTNLEVKEAAATYMLSKRWYYCWTSRPNLILHQFQGNTYMPLEKYVEVPDHPCEIAILDGYNTLQTLKLTGASITDQQFRDVPKHFRIGSNIML